MKYRSSRQLVRYPLFAVLCGAACGGGITDMGDGTGGANSDGLSGSANNDDVCPTGTFDHDQQSATTCQSWRRCPPGQYVTRAGSATLDRECAACPAGTFSSSDNALTCETWSDCSPGEFLDAGATSQADRLCTPCEAGTFSDDDNAASCEPCPAGTDSDAGAPNCEPEGGGGGDGSGGAASGGNGTGGAASGGASSGGAGVGGLGGAGAFECSGSGIEDAYYDADLEHCGEVWTYWWGTGTLIDPECGDEPCFVGDELCALVDLPAGDGATFFPFALIGWNVFQDPGGPLLTAETTGTGITVDYTASGATGEVRVIVQSGSSDFCAVAEGSPATFAWGDFKTQCFDLAGSHTPLPVGADIKAILLTVNADDIPQTITDFCLNGVTFDD